MTTLLNLITTPVAVLNATPLETRVGLSGEDPLSTRHRGERFRVFLSLYDPQGRFAERRELEPVSAGERRLVDLSTLVRPIFGDENVLAVVHRVPASLCPEGRDPTASPAPPAAHGDYDLFRTMVEYAFPSGGRGGVIYETPPRFNDLRSRTRPASTLVFSSKLAVGARNDTVICLINYSIDPEWRRPVSLQFRLFDATGAERYGGDCEVAPFTARLLPVRDLVGGADVLSTFSLVGWSRDGSLIPLFLQMDPSGGSVAVEHSHPPQTYLMTADPRQRFRIKDEAVQLWEARRG